MAVRQRVVLVVGLGLGVAAAVVATATSALLNDLDGGWFAYAPNTGATFSPHAADSAIYRTAGIWLAAIAVWTLVSLFILRQRDEQWDQQLAERRSAGSSDE